MINSHVRFYCWEESWPEHRNGCSSSPPPPRLRPPPPFISPPPPQVLVTTSQEDKETIPPLVQIPSSSLRLDSSLSFYGRP